MKPVSLHIGFRLVRTMPSVGEHDATGTMSTPENGATPSGSFTAEGTVDDADGIHHAYLLVTWLGGRHTIELCGADGVASCSGTSVAFSESINPADYGLTEAIQITLATWVEDVSGDVRGSVSHAVTQWSP